MLTLTYFTSILISIGFFFLGILLHSVLKPKNKGNWEELYKEKENQNNKLAKRLKKDEAKITQLTSEKDTLRNNIDKLKAESNQTIGKAEDRVKIAETKLQNLKASVDKINSENNRLSIDHTAISERYKKFKEKYDAQAGDYKDKVKLSNHLQHENEKLKNTLAKLKSQITALKEEIENQTNTVNSAKESQKELRLLRVKNKKLSDDVVYWEKKHYDTHHELAALIKTQEGQSKKYLELESFRNGDQVLMDNLKKQIEQYKTKFIDVNHKYRELISKN